MQIDVRIVPFYEKPFDKEFPGITALLKSASYGEAFEGEVSLYVLVDSLVSLSRHPMTSSAVKEKIRPHVDKMVPVKRMARESLTSRKLNELDQFLYQIEDLFEDLENNL
jgi:hypothetical protein